MKKITFLFTGLVMMFASMDAQTYDVGVVAIPNMYTNQTVYPNAPTVIQYTRENFADAVTSAAVDSFTMEISVNGIKRQTFFRNMATPFPISGSETTQGVTALDWSTLGLTAGNITVCVRTRLWKGGVMIDADPNNDEFCLGVIYSATPLKYDLSPKDLVFSTPSYPPNAHIPIPTFPTQMAFDLHNVGTTDIPAGFEISFDFTVDNGTPLQFTGTLQMDLSFSGVANLLLNYPSSTQLPLVAGPFDICMEMTLPDDLNTSNDKTCVTYNMGNPASIDEVNSKVYGNFYYNNNELKIKFNDFASGMSTIDIFEISGKQVANYNLNVDQNKDVNLDLQKLNLGVHIANIQVNGELLTFKFIKE